MSESNEKNIYAVHFSKYGIFCGILFVMFGLMLLFVILSRSAWNKKLSSEVQECVTEYYDENYTVGNVISFSDSFSLNAFFCELKLNGKDSEKYAVLVRITTFYGPLPAVFIYDSKTKKTEFLCFSDLKNLATDIVIENSKKLQIEYWTDKIGNYLNVNINQNREGLK